MFSVIFDSWSYCFYFAYTFFSNSIFGNYFTSLLDFYPFYSFWCSTLIIFSYLYRLPFSISILSFAFWVYSFGCIFLSDSFSIYFSISFSLCPTRFFDGIGCNISSRFCSTLILTGYYSPLCSNYVEEEAFSSFSLDFNDFSYALHYCSCFTLFSFTECWYGC